MISSFNDLVLHFLSALTLREYLLCRHVVHFRPTDISAAFTITRLAEDLFVVLSAGTVIELIARTRSDNCYTSCAKLNSVTEPFKPVNNQTNRLTTETDI